MEDKVRMKDKRELILETANEIITEQGLKELTLAKIAKKSNISKGTLYYYYNSKSDLLFDLADRYMKFMTDKFLQIINDTKNNSNHAKIIEDVYKTIVEHGTRNRIHIYLIHEALSGNEEIKIKYQDIYSKWLKIIKDEINVLSNSSSDDNLVPSYILLSSLDGLVLQSLLGINNIPLVEISNYIAKIMNGGGDDNNEM